MELNLIETIVLSLIQSYKVEDLHYASSRGVSLAESLRQYSPGYITLGRIIGGIYKRDSDQLTAEAILGWLRESRPDLYEAIESNQIIKNWFRKQLKEVREMIWGDRL